MRSIGEGLRSKYHLLGTRISLIEIADTGRSDSHEKKKKDSRSRKGPWDPLDV